MFNKSECEYALETCDPKVNFQMSQPKSLLIFKNIGQGHIFIMTLHSVTFLSASYLLLQTFNTSIISAQCPDAECLFAFYGGETLYHKYLIVFQFYNVFLFFWCANFVTALGQVTLSGAFASYYWAFKKPEDIPAFPIFASLGRALR